MSTIRFCPCLHNTLQTYVRLARNWTETGKTGQKGIMATPRHRRSGLTGHATGRPEQMVPAQNKAANASRRQGKKKEKKKQTLIITNRIKCRITI